MCNHEKLVSVNCVIKCAVCGAVIQPGAPVETLSAPTEAAPEQTDKKPAPRRRKKDKGE